MVTYMASKGSAGNCSGPGLFKRRPIDCGPLSQSGNPYRIKVEDEFRDGTGTYTVYFQRLTASAACDDTPLTRDVPVEGSIDELTDTDLFSFNVTSSEQ